MRLLPLVLSLLTIAAAPAPLPPQIATHVKDGHFDPGDYGWTRGAFPGATAEQVADWKAFVSYAHVCGDIVPDPQAQARLAGMGYHPPAHYWRRYAPALCSEIAMARFTTEGFKSWESYVHARDTALPYLRTYLFAVDSAQQTVPSDKGSLRDQLQAIVLPDQMLRMAEAWGQGDAAAAPPLDADTIRFITTTLWAPIRIYDHRNTAWLKAEVARHGWPTITQVGKQSASNAWLLVQHADDDPLFQLDMLRLMEPLVAEDEIDKHDFALLTDRVLLPLTGKQRYGSQFTCDEKGWHPQPLEDEAQVDVRRKSLGLPPIAEYRQTLIHHYGETCPS